MGFGPAGHDGGLEVVLAHLLLEQARPRLGEPSRGCITTRLPYTPGVATYSAAVPRPLTMIGMPLLTLRYRTVAGDLQLNSRLWDVAPDGTQTLVSRGVYRAVAPNPAGAEINVNGKFRARVNRSIRTVLAMSSPCSGGIRRFVFRRGGRTLTGKFDAFIDCRPAF